MGCVHPSGEKDDYDGLYYRKNEMGKLAHDLVDKPLFIEHMEDQVGHIKHAWVGKNNECFAIFETAKNFPGYLAENLINNQVCTDLSLGHNVHIDQEKNVVVNKQAIEVSICEKGARPDTHIYAFEKNDTATDESKNKNYIIQMKSSILKMSDSTEPTIQPMESESEVQPEQENKTEESSPLVAEYDEIFKQMKDQAASFEALKLQFQQSEDARKNAEGRLSVLNKRKRDQREQVIEGTLKKFIGEMVKKWKTELEPHQMDLEQVLSAMKNNESSESMVKLLACTASSMGKNAAELEKSYQEQKVLKQKMMDLKNELQKMSTPAFSSPSERFVDLPVKASSAAPPKRARYSAPLPPGIQLPRKGIAGMQNRNPDLWAQMTAGSNNVGMGWFSESNLVGKEYADGRRPKKIPL